MIKKAALLILLLPAVSFAKTHVLDTAGVMPAETARLEERLSEYETRTGIHVDVVTIQASGGANLIDYGDRTFHKRSMEMYKNENTALLLLIIVQNGQVRFKVGYGLLPRLSEDFCDGVADQYIVPEFERQQYGRGVNAALTAIFAKIGR